VQCLRGASEVQREVLAKLSSPDVRAYVVWVPMSRGMERDVPNATKEVSDPRARHYWDGEGQLTAGYRDVLRAFIEPVWDTYVLYGKDARWETARPPVPAYWMHQLGSPKRPRAIGPFWDPAAFLDRTRSLLAP
jgi:hypothetical protein